MFMRCDPQEEQLDEMIRFKIEFLMKSLRGFGDQLTKVNSILSVVFLRFLNDLVPDDLINTINLDALRIPEDHLKILHHKYPTSLHLTYLVKKYGKEAEVFFFAACYNHQLLERQ